jgi:hypothetical protein
MDNATGQPVIHGCNPDIVEKVFFHNRRLVESGRQDELSLPFFR